MGRGVNSGAHAKGGGQLEAAVGGILQHKGAAVLSAQHGKNAQSQVGHVVDGMAVEDMRVEDALRGERRRRRVFSRRDGDGTLATLFSLFSGHDDGEI